MNYVKIYTKTYRDNSARYIELPSLLIEQDGETKVFEQLLKYQIKYSHKSKTWHNKLSLKEAIPYAIGRKKLEEIGIHNEFEKELKIMRYDAPLKLLSTNNDA